MTSRLPPLLATLSLCLLLTACEELGISLPGQNSAQQEAEGKAIGSACRHAGRAIEDCYTLNPDMPKAAIFAGWKEMNDYMVENKIAEVAPVLPPPEKKDKEKERQEREAERQRKKEEAEAARAAADKAAEEEEVLPPSKRRRLQAEQRENGGH